MATVKLDPAKGVQIPNLTTTERNAISSPETGALIWNTTTSAINQYNGSAWEITYTDTNTQVAGITSSANATAITIDSSENVGIGESSPARFLHVKDPTGGNIVAFFESTDANGSLSIGDNSGSVNVESIAGAMVLNVNGNTTNGGGLTEALRINTAGNVGIGAAPESGTSGDVTELDIGLMSLSMWKGENQPNDSASYGYNCYKTGGFVYKAKKTSSGADNRPAVYEQAYGTHKFRVGAPGSADAAITWTDAMTISNAGQVTIPNQPAFWVNKPASVQSSWGDGATFATPFSASTIMKGGCSLGSSVVTVPTAGLYCITVQFDSLTASYNIRAGGIHLKHNGTKVQPYSGHDNWNAANYVGFSNHHYTWWSHYLVQASANDTFGAQGQIYHNGGTPSISYSASMQGYLIG
jgi:hypothetical protein